MLRDQPVADAFVMLTAPLASEALHQTEQLGSDTDAHGLRALCTTLRRLRAIWWAFEPLLDEREARVVRKRFKRIADIAREPHDLEAACGLLSRARKTGSRVAPVMRTISRERRDASMSSCDAIRNAGIDVMLRRALADARRSLEARVVNQTLEEFARARVSLAGDALRKKERRAVKMKRMDVKALRSIEEAATRFQCMIEVFSPVLERGHRHTMENLCAAQAALGQLDSVIASEAVVRRVAARSTDKDAVQEAVRWLNKEKKVESQAAVKILRALAA
ncbi:CHAD domain-containing protein [Caballeronia humi]|nr:CHAD domain-containing protein [Caballeronia humi]